MDRRSGKKIIGCYFIQLTLLLIFSSQCYCMIAANESNLISSTGYVKKINIESKYIIIDNKKFKLFENRINSLKGIESKDKVKFTYEKKTDGTYLVFIKKYTEE